jgi:hypothetical protein
MRRLSRGLPPVLLLSTTVLVAACAAPPPPAGHLPAAAPSAQSTEQRGANALLASLPLPPGARRLPTAPQGIEPKLPDRLVNLPSGHGSVATGWWRSPLGLTATQNWVSGLHRRGFPESGTGPDFRMAGREWPAADGWGVRIAQIAAFASGGTVYLEAVAEAEFVGRRPAASLIPRRAASVAVRTRTQQGTTSGRVTDPARIGRAADLLDALPLDSGASVSCPDDVGGVTELDFGGGHRAELQLSGCRAISVFGPGLPADGVQLAGGPDRSAAVLKALGLSVTGTAATR